MTNNPEPLLPETTERRYPNGENLKTEKPKQVFTTVYLTGGHALGGYVLETDYLALCSLWEECEYDQPKPVIYRFAMKRGQRTNGERIDVAQIVALEVTK